MPPRHSFKSLSLFFMFFPCFSLFFWAGRTTVFPPPKKKLAPRPREIVVSYVMQCHIISLTTVKTRASTSRLILPSNSVCKSPFHIFRRRRRRARMSFSASPLCGSANVIDDDVLVRGGTRAPVIALHIRTHKDTHTRTHAHRQTDRQTDRQTHTVLVIAPALSG